MAVRLRAGSRGRLEGRLAVPDPDPALRPWPARRRVGEGPGAGPSPSAPVPVDRGGHPVGRRCRRHGGAAGAAAPGAGAGGMVTKRRGDGPARVLAAAVAGLPGDRADWGRAMRAELASIGPRRDRWYFVGGCLRAIVTQYRLLRAVLHAVAVLGVVAAAFAWSATVGFPPLTAILDF